jgi:hypothetical protein
MTALAERPGRRAEMFRIGLTRLKLWIGRQDEHVGVEVQLDPALARQLAGDLLRQAHEVELAAAPVLEELRVIVNQDGEPS